MSLIANAVQGTLPPFQRMDADTLRWLADNKPSFARRGSLDCAGHYPLEKEAMTIGQRYASPDVVDGIHGVTHAVRVSVMAYAIGRYADLDEKKARLLAAAGLLHDTQRRHDQNDPEHGRLSAEGLANHRDMTEGLDVAVLATTIKLHDEDCADLALDTQHQAAAWAVDIIKVADALDRYRLPKTKWWLKDECLRVQITDDLKATAFDLVTGSEQRVLNGLPPAQAVLVTARELGLIL